MLIQKTISPEKGEMDMAENESLDVKKTTVYLPAALLKELKLLAVEADETMTDIIVRAITKEVKEMKRAKK